MKAGQGSCGQRGRYLSVVLLGFGLDLGVSVTLNQALGLSLTTAAGAGFLIALTLNHLLYETWVFRPRRPGRRLRRVGATLGAAGVVLLTRLAVVGGLSRVFASDQPISAAAIVLVGAGASMTVNYLLVSAAFTRKTNQHA